MSNYDNFEYYALQNYGGNLIGVDYDSGGYPWVPATLIGVKWWSNQKEAEEYSASFPGQFTVVKVKLILEKV